MPAVCYNGGVKRVTIAILLAALLAFALTRFLQRSKAHRAVDVTLAPAQSSLPDPPAILKQEGVSTPVVSPLFLARGDLPWEAQIEAIAARQDVPDRLKARFLISMLPGLPEEALAKAAEEATARLPDADYPSVLQPVVIDPHTHGMAMSVLFADLMQRPDSITLPVLLSIARDPTHPYAHSARDNLQLLLGHTFGSDWLRWEQAIRSRLAPAQQRN